jgi:hypothetical protein
MKHPVLQTMSIAFFFGLFAGCGEDETTTIGDCSPGMETCECINDQFCFGGLDCLSGICINLGNDDEMNDGDPDESGDGDPGESGDGDPGESGDGDPGESGDGDPGESGDGDPGESGDECVQTYNSCYDFDSQTLTGECCEGTLCVTAEVDELSGCVPECATHSECSTDCCVPVSNGMNYCSPATSLCNDFGKCIDTCFYNNDGVCDDGGPGSLFNVCEYGTDCTDCGSRF